MVFKRLFKKYQLANIVLGLLLMVGFGAVAQSADSPANSSGCLACHDGIESIRDVNSKMMQEILIQGQKMGDPAGCVACHGGDPAAEDADSAHAGKTFYADPGSPWINKFTCGQCHKELVEAQWNGLMMTEAGKIQGAAWSFGSLEGYDHRWGNYDASNPPETQKRLGTAEYCDYMERLKTAEPQVFPEKMTALPEAPTDLSQLAEHPEQAVFTYMRSDCQRCHLGVKGRQVRGDYRGMGCSACHIPYGNEGFYEGGDQTIPGDEPGAIKTPNTPPMPAKPVTIHLCPARSAKRVHICGGRSRL